VGLAEEWVVTRLLNAAEADPADAVAFKAVAAVAEAATRASHFVRANDGLGHWRVAPGAGLRLPVYAAARSAAELLADPRRFTIRAGPGPECGWLFLDEHGRRRWCSLGTCGRHCTVRAA
jgi:predicted RNA-binding Zn ribbon-like protein